MVNSIKDKLLEYDKFIYNIKSTSRNIKLNEKDCIDYHFINKQDLNTKLEDSKEQNIITCYEACPNVFALYRVLEEMNIGCSVAAPSLLPRKTR